MHRFIFLFLLSTNSAFCLDVILLFGPPGSGKGTFAQYAAGKGYGHVSAGDLVRDEIAHKTVLGLAIEEFVKRGEYIDPDTMFQLIKNRSMEYVAKNQPFIIDGYGRTLDDAARLKRFVKEIEARVQVVYLDASNATCKERICSRLVCPECHAIYNKTLGFEVDEKCATCTLGYLQVRLNDSPEVIEKRLKLYREAIQPSYSSFLDDFEHLLFSTDCDLQSCFSYYDTLLNKD